MDHPEADYICWRCERQDDSDGAQILLDGHEALSRCDEQTREALRHVHAEVHVRSGEPPSLVPILRTTQLGDRLFFAAWIKPVETDVHSIRAYQTLGREMDRLQDQNPIRVLLDVGEALVIDNGRMLHGRDSINHDSKRLLRRFWITTRG
ncbi:MAG: TauD/TfdA family dioxygenase [Phycisphaeraceae bacterium]|nr:TauD/TfdA family dioxygenase [Phycisphaeraceae bacterium]MCB9848778.1 TauD/TfdA family dioxygenase [Phycisphaeraceae bacterium]